MRQAALIAAGYPAIMDPLEIHRLLKKNGKPGPGAYEVKSDFKPNYKASVHQNFNSSTQRFQDNGLIGSINNSKRTAASLGPGCYPISEEVELDQVAKRKTFQKDQGIINFHRQRKLYPDMTSISTVQLNKMREFEYEKIGPGSYSIGVEKMHTGADTGQKKLMGKAVASAFSTTEARVLDTRTAP